MHEPDVRVCDSNVCDNDVSISSTLDQVVRHDTSTTRRVPTRSIGNQARSSAEKDMNSDLSLRQRDRKQAASTTASKVSKAEASAQGGSDVPFSRIRDMCESDCIDPGLDISPESFADNRRTTWPMVNEEEMGSRLANIYNLTRATGVPNAIGARQDLPSDLNIAKWEEYLDDSKDERELLSFIRYGFPLGYMGPPSDTKGISNHKSASDFQAQIDDFISKELDMGGTIGPLKSPPFQEWCHVSPLMSREKKGTAERRVIVDMTYPPRNVRELIYIQEYGDGCTPRSCPPKCRLLHPRT